MANYKEQQINGQITKWNRAGEININNSYGIAPIVTFFEETITRLDNGEMFIQKIGQISKQFDNMSDSIQIIDMSTGVPKGQQISYKDIYDIVASLYLDLALKRDAGE
jgi:hypothetical protein